MKKKLSSVFLVTILSLSVFGIQGVKADTVVLNGKISFFVPKKAGYHDKWLTENDCAVDNKFKYLPKGTKVIATNLSNGKSKTLAKWDIGDFPSGVILDVLPNTFVYLGGSKTHGYIDNGRAEWLDPYGQSITDSE